MKETKIAKDKPLIEEVVEWINPWGDKESAISTCKVAEAVKKLKEEVGFCRDFFIGYGSKGCLKEINRLVEEIYKIMGNFNYIGKSNDIKEKWIYQKDKGCGELTADKDGIHHFRCGNKDYDTKKIKLCPKCEVGLKEDKQ